MQVVVDVQLIGTNASHKVGTIDGSGGGGGGGRWEWDFFVERYFGDWTGMVFAYHRTELHLAKGVAIGNVWLFCCCLLSLGWWRRTHGSMHK